MKLQSGICAMLLALTACSGSGVGTKADDSLSTPTAQDAGASAAMVRPVARAQGQSIANAPDHGALVDYPRSGVVRQEGALKWFPAEISEAHALRSIATGQMSFAMPDGRQVELRYLRHSEQLEGNWTWVGEVVGGDPQQKAMITFGTEAVFGSIPQGAAPPLQIETRQGKLFVVAMDPSRAINAARNDDTKIPSSQSFSTSPAAVAQFKRNNAEAPTILGNVGTLRAAATSVNTVDAVVGYTSGLATRLGGDSGATTRMAYLVEYANQALGNSEVAGHFRLVKAVKLDYADNTPNSDALDALTLSTDPAFAPLQNARQEFGGDIVLLVRDFKKEHSSCGIAWLLGGGQKAITQSSANSAYGVISDGTYKDGSSTWYCTAATLAHESGHLLGSTHDRANSSSTGRYAYSYGYNASGVCDIMAYCDAENKAYQVYSNPRITLCGGAPCGIEDSEDNARSMNQTIPVIAKFRAAMVPFSGNPRNDFDGDGRSDLFWRNLADGRNIVWRAAEAGNQSNPAQVSNFTWKVVGTGDFDGDGKSDLFWRNAGSGQNIIWSSGDASGLRYAATVPSQDWNVGVVGDFNGDGRDDIFWRNLSSGENIIWWSGDSAGYALGQSLSTNWKIAGSGDFDGDGQEDVLWRDSSSGANIVWWSGKSSGLTALASVGDLSWDVVAIDDFDGDGRADLFWRNRVTGENIIWLQGSAANWVREPTINTAWEVKSSGDYNGDGEADIFWRHSVNGQNAIWDSARYANGRSLTGVSDLSWTVLP